MISQYDIDRELGNSCIADDLYAAAAQMKSPALSHEDDVLPERPAHSQYSDGILHDMGCLAMSGELGLEEMDTLADISQTLYRYNTWASAQEEKVRGLTVERNLALAAVVGLAGLSLWLLHARGLWW